MPGSNVTDEIVEKAWTAIVGSDIAAQCFNASIIRADLKKGIEAALADHVVVPREPTEAMKDAGLRAAMTEFYDCPSETTIEAVRRRLCDVSYRAMIAAAGGRS